MESRRYLFPFKSCAYTPVWHPPSWNSDVARHVTWPILQVRVSFVMKYGLGNCFEQRQCFCNVSEWYCVSVNVIFEKTPFLYGFPPLSPSHVTGNATSVHRWIELIKTKKMVYHYRGSSARWLRSEGGWNPPPLVRSRNQNRLVRPSVKTA